MKKIIILVGAVLSLSIGLFAANASADLAIPNRTFVTPTEYAKVIIKDYKGHVVMETTSDYWVEHQDEISKKHRLGKYSPNKMIVNHLKGKGELAKSKAMEAGEINEVKADEILEDMLNAGVIEQVPGKADVYKLTEAAMNKKSFEVIEEKQP